MDIDIEIADKVQKIDELGGAEALIFSSYARELNAGLKILKRWKADRESYEKDFLAKLLGEMTEANSKPIEEWKKEYPDLHAFMIKNGFVYKKEFDRGQMKDVLKQDREKIIKIIENNKFHDNLLQKDAYYISEETLKEIEDIK